MAVVHPTRTKSSPVPKILATVSEQTPALDGVDIIRLDASHGSLRELCRLRSRYDLPSFLDLPGPSDHDRTSLLTTSEFLIFAATEAFEWVGLRGITGNEDLMRARDLLPLSTHLACTVSGVKSLNDHELRNIASAADALILPYGEVVQCLGSDAARRQMERFLVLASEARRPLLLSGGLLSTMVDSVMPEISQLEMLAEFAFDGCAGFVLIEETAASPHAQLCVDTLEMVLAPWKASPPRHQGTARVAGAPMLSPLLPPVSQR